MLRRISECHCSYMVSCSNKIVKHSGYRQEGQDAKLSKHVQTLSDRDELQKLFTC